MAAAVRKVLGNGRLSRAILRGLLVTDSLLLVARVLGRRLTKHPPKWAADGKPQVLYIDCGTHKEGAEIRWMMRWFSGRYDLTVLGFEGSGEHFPEVRAALAGFDKVRLRQIALVGPDHVGKTVKLYKGGGDGRGDSVFADRGADYEEVAAGRLSEILSEDGFALTETPALLRMNIEGAEQFVIDDLIAVGSDALIDGYYGMWDDLSKIDTIADDRFRRTLRDHNIRNVTFNDRDLSSPLRRFAIRMDIDTSIRVGLLRSRLVRNHE